MKESLPLQFLLLSLALLTPAWAAKTPHPQVLLSQSQHVELAASLDETAEKAAQAAQEEVERQVKELEAEGEVEKDLSKDRNEEDKVTSRQRQTAHSAQPAEEYNENGIQRSLMPVAVPVVSVASEGAAPPVDQERKSKAAKAAETMSEALKKKGKTEEAELAAIVGKSYDMTEAAKAMTEKMAGVKHVVSVAKTKTVKAATHDVKPPATKISHAAKATTRDVKAPGTKISHAKVAGKKSLVADATKAAAASMTKLAEQATNPRMRSDSKAGHAFSSAYWDKHAKELGAKKYARPMNKIVKAEVHAQPEDAAKTAAHSQSQQKHGTWEQTDHNYVNPKLPHLADPKLVAATDDETSESTLSRITNSARNFFDHAIADITGFSSDFSKVGSVSEKGVASVAGPEDGADAAAAQKPVGEPLIPEIEDEKTGKSAGSAAVPEKPSEDAVGIASQPAPNSVKSIHTKTHLGSDSISSHAAQAAKQTVAKASAQKDVSQRLQANAVAMGRDSGANAVVSQTNIAQAAAHVWDAAKRGKIIDVAKTADPQPATIADPQPATIEKLAGGHSAEHELTEAKDMKSVPENIQRTLREHSENTQLPGDEIDAKAEANLTAISGFDQVALQLSRSKHRLSHIAGDAATGKGIKAKTGAQKPISDDLTNFAAKLSQKRKKKGKATDGKVTANTKAKGREKPLDAPMHLKKAIADASQKLSTEDHPVHPNKAVADAKVKASTEHKKVAPPVKKDEKAAVKTETHAWTRHHFARAPRYGSDEMTSDWGQEYAAVRLSDKEMNQYYMRKMHHRKLEAEANADDDDDDDDSTHSGSRRNTFAGILGLGLATVLACL